MSLENENPINKLHKNYILKIKDNKKTTYIKAFAFEPNEKKMKIEKLCYKTSIVKKKGFGAEKVIWWWVPGWNIEWREFNEN